MAQPWCLVRAAVVGLSVVASLSHRASMASDPSEYGIETQIVAITRGNGVPSVPPILGGGAFEDISAHSFDGLGNLRFSGPGSTFGTGGVWRVDSTGPEVETFTGFPAGPGGDTLDRILGSSVRVGAQGVAFRSTSDQAGGVWIHPTGSDPTPVAHAFVDDPTLGPGLGPGVFFEVAIPKTGPEAFSNPAINDSNVVAFRGEIDGTGINFTNDRGIWRWENGNLAPVARTGVLGSQGPQLSDDSVFGNFQSPLVDDLGRTAFGATVLGPIRTGVWQADPSGTTPVVVEGTDGPLGPGLGPGATISTVNLAGLADDGTMAITGRLNGDTSSSLIMRVDDSAREVIALAGVTGPLGPNYGDETWSIVSAPAVSSNGQMLFFGQLSDSGASLWQVTGSGNELVALRGVDNAFGPGLDNGKAFSNFAGSNLINSHGQIAFTANLLRVNGVDLSNDSGLWVRHGGENILIAREGSQVDTDPTGGVDLRTISSIRMVTDVGAVLSSGGEGGIDQWFDDFGQLSYVLEFTDNSVGLFVTQVPVPEPASVTLAAIGLASLTVFCRRRRKRRSVD